ncbi:hypothetical protein LT330_010158 [Penicillium expansum]|nr:hypothetical protein LT330_010158 [Penicillium expansum]
MASEDNEEHCQHCDTKCLCMDAGSSQGRLLKLGPVDGSDEAYCGPTLTFDSYFGSENHVLDQNMIFMPRDEVPILIASIFSQSRILLPASVTLV